MKGYPIEKKTVLTFLPFAYNRSICRSFPLNETSLFQSETQSEENVLVTASCDRSIRIWWEVFHEIMLV